MWGLATIPMALFFLHQVNEVFFVLFLFSCLAWGAAGNVLFLLAGREDEK
jgi:hypothetical protein